jgi:hypothetical protein
MGRRSLNVSGFNMYILLDIAEIQRTLLYRYEHRVQLLNIHIHTIIYTPQCCHV